MFFFRSLSTCFAQGNFLESAVGHRLALEPTVLAVTVLEGLTNGAASPALALHKARRRSSRNKASLPTANMLPENKENGDTQNTNGRTTRYCDAPGLVE